MPQRVIERALEKFKIIITTGMGDDVRKYTKSEVALHNGLNNSGVWMIVKDSVYDLTDYLELHPGGSELLIEFAGRDGTKAFNDSGHSSDAKKQLSLHKIGELEKEAKPENHDESSKKITKKRRFGIFRKILGNCGA